jgi:hypothetical protein
LNVYRDYSKAENFARKLVMIRHICYGWHHPEFAKVCLFFTRCVQLALLTFGLQGLELLSTILRSRGNEFDADVMMRWAVYLLRGRVSYV